MMNDSLSTRYNEAKIEAFKQRVRVYHETLSDKIAKMSQSSLIDTLSKDFELQMRAHLTSIGHRVDDTIKLHVSAVMDDVNKTIRQALVEAISHRTKVETEFGAYESCGVVCQQLAYRCSLGGNGGSSNNKRQQGDDYYELEDDELMINESTDEFNTDVLSELQDQIDNLEQFEDAVSLLISQPIMLDDVEHKIRQGDTIRQSILARVSSSLDHNNNTVTSPLSHTSFVMNTNMKVSDNSLFKSDSESFVEIECDDASSRAGGCQLFDRLKFELINMDAGNRLVEVRIKEKTKRERRLIRAYFNTSAGIHRLTIRFDQVDIPGSPFLFVVFPGAVLGTTTGGLHHADNNAEFKVPLVPTPPKQEPRFGQQHDLNVSMTSSVSIESNMNTLTNNSSSSSRNSLMKGRGKMLRSILSPSPSLSTPGHGSTNSGLSSLLQQQQQQQQRPVTVTLPTTSRYADVDDDDDDDDYDDEMQQQTVMGESSRSIVTRRDIEFMSMPTFQRSTTSCAISDHLRRHGVGVGKPKLIFDPANPPVPNIQAVFMCKYENLEFPIGVRACERRNWVIVCESGANQVKVFERSAGTLLFTLKGNTPSYFTLKRPSAALIEHNELYIKDDKEILVFDMDKDFCLLRKFGANVLRRPYGLSFSPQGYLMLIDADGGRGGQSTTSLVMFDKKTGDLVSSRPFHPGMRERAASEVLLERHNGEYNRLGDQIQPFDKSKLRFIYACNESFYVSDLGRTVVYETDLQGGINMAFGRFGKKRNEMIEPSGLHVESDGHAIVVGDSKNDRIQVYSRDGLFQCNIEVDNKIIRPSDIYMDREGFLYVSGFIQRCVKKFKIIAQ